MSRNFAMHGLTAVKFLMINLLPTDEKKTDECEFCNSVFNEITLT